MTDIVREAEELLAGVTPGEWKASNSNGIHVGYRCVATTDMEPREQRVKDAAFIAAAPRLIRSLLQRLRETEETNQKLQNYQCFSESHVVEHLEEDIRALRAENAKLSAAVKGETFYHSDEAANEEMNRLRAEREEMVTALKRVAKWHGEFPPTDHTWVDGTPISYGAAFGSNGERDFMREVAQEALTRAGEE